MTFNDCSRDRSNETKPRSLEVKGAGRQRRPPLNLIFGRMASYWACRARREVLPNRFARNRNKLPLSLAAPPAMEARPTPQRQVSTTCARIGGSEIRVSCSLIEAAEQTAALKSQFLKIESETGYSEATRRSPREPVRVAPSTA